MKFYKCTINQGHLVCPELHKDLAAKGAQGLEVEVTIEKVGDQQRSNAQNSYLWGVLYPTILKFYLGNIRAFIEDLMKAVRATLTIEFIHAMMKMWFNNGKSTKGLSTEGFIKYHDDIREYYFHTHGIDIPLPNQPTENNNA